MVLTLLTTLPDLLMTVMVSPTPMMRERGVVEVEASACGSPAVAQGREKLCDELVAVE
jgi:hypothetical protein